MPKKYKISKYLYWPKNPEPSEGGKMKICKYCGCRVWKDNAEELPSWIVDGTKFPLSQTLSVCFCPCHIVGTNDETQYREAVEEIWGYKRRSE